MYKIKFIYFPETALKYKNKIHIFYNEEHKHSLHVCFVFRDQLYFDHVRTKPVFTVVIEYMHDILFFKSNPILAQ